MFAARHAAKCRADAYKATDDCQQCEHSKRDPHRRRRFVRNVRTVRMSAVFVRMHMRGDVMRNVIVYWSNMLAGLMSRTIAGRCTYRIVWRQSFFVGASGGFVRLPPPPPAAHFP